VLGVRVPNVSQARVTTRYEPISTSDARARALLPGDDRASSPAADAQEPRLLVDLVALTKPRITLMVVVTMLGGIWLAVHRLPRAAVPSATHLSLAILGTALVVGSANALNMWLERDTDGLMARTRNRPLPTGRLDPRLAIAFGLLLGAVSIPLLVLAVNATTGLLAAVALVSYAGIYTPLKRRTTASLLVGAVPGAIPPLLGWTTVTGRIELPGLMLFGIMFLWQIPHFLAIATFRRHDYARAGLKVLPVTRGERVTRVHIVAWLAALLVCSVGIVATGVGGTLYLTAAIVLGWAFFAHGAWGLRAGTGARWARGLFATSIVYLVLLFTALMISP
jgi:protoheme IX farnesyltransferase